ncbi:MAG TPA: phage terminase large subunit [Candidatus Enterousia avicola]|uniref:Phage terminase large subunit n=1 Tax=Candidatus Enterousia avicola TaxID=2840787 RepID=A0A9D1MS76_9PROT|nr:phage terminase large subunit [Candidatus Enterousia avicola]
MYNEFYKFLDTWNKVLGFSTPAHHLKIMEFLVSVWETEPHRGLLMAFRHSGKSTVVGIFAACVLYLHPETRILILSAENSLSSRMVAHIKHILENHPMCKDLVPAVKKEWAQGRITVNRPIGIREPSVTCQGIHGNITGLRADLIICDDVEVPNTSNTAQKRETLRERLRELDFILSPTGTMIYIGTPHTLDSIYRTKED